MENKLIEEGFVSHLKSACIVMKMNEQVQPENVDLCKTGSDKARRMKGELKMRYAMMVNSMSKNRWG